MVQTTFVASFLGGILLVAGVVILLSRGRFRYTQSLGRGDDDLSANAARALRTPVVWTVSFVILALLTGGAAVLAIGGFNVSAAVARAATALLAAVGVAVLVGYLFSGTFVLARSRGLHSAQAAAFGSWAVGLLLLIAVAVSLVGLV